MPEIAEVARVVHFLRIHLAGKTIAKVVAPDDASIFGKVGTSGPAFEKALAGKKVLEVASQGKYFWMVLSQPPHPVMHLGMTGWVQIRGIQTGYTRYIERTKNEPEHWPPKYWKFHLEAATGASAPDKVEVAFTDFRRFGRVRLVDCPGPHIRLHPPLVDNGPDPVVDKHVFTEAFLREKMRRRHVPVKALLLDQATLSGVGNWVADEVLYQARVHPEEYCDEVSDADVGGLYRAIRYVCETAVEKLGDSDEFPEDWLFKHRWGKGKKDAPTKLPSGEEIVHITVGGRTSCVVPSVQKRKGRGKTTIDEIKGEEGEGSAEAEDGTESRFFQGKGKRKGKKQVKSEAETETDVDAEERPSKKAKTAKPKRAMKVTEEEEEVGKEEEKPAPKTSSKSIKQVKEEAKPIKLEPELGRRRSSRLSRVAA
ncbi:Formamidopyrimidine-DNA glycosylase N-terminal domain-containing protein [Daldinia caldariorum]|uniref:Formamidopyrimidine-DNA glycosylase N-terminal domain-containing protein n=1 Tax=Daldinia caldariorum TaxID=326644 RepID=UPI002008B883|nr:Formamidopyrimidine-DNA glycosylase N-terminal domain-containing protein [Daldinia caldariorum]KAI1473246.1 Formamidopyrimidine-DNA glycosylase N-terminal domain-containing protein [Daldinia caldariorum]